MMKTLWESKKNSSRIRTTSDVSKLPQKEETSKSFLPKENKEEPDFSEVLCFHCGKKGHYANNCTNDRIEGCHHCGKPGHKAVDCRSKKKTMHWTKAAGLETVGGIYDRQVQQIRECCLLIGQPDAKLCVKFQSLDLAVNHEDSKMLNVPQVPVTIEKRKTVAVVDSGASVSIVDQCFVNKLSATLETTPVPRIEAVNGDLLPLVCHVKLNVQLGGRIIPHKFYVLEGGSSSVTTLVLGNDFGRTAKLVISPSGPSVYFESDYQDAIRSHYCAGFAENV